jgi:cytochrome c oxidase subunit 2
LSRRPTLTVLATVLAVGIAAAPAHAISLGPPDAQSPSSEGISSAYWVMIVVAVLAIVSVNAALIAAVIRSRERRGREPRRVSAARGALRPVAGTLGVLAAAIFVYGVIASVNVRELEPSGPDGLSPTQTAQVGVSDLPSLEALEGAESATGEEPLSGEEPAEASPLQIDVIGQQWLWRFEYPGGQPGQRTFSYGELVVPVDTAVLLNITSTDVLHTWWVPALGGQVQAAPGNVTQTWFKAEQEGRYEGRSTIFSGTGYPAMRAWVRVVGVPEYQAYVERLAADLSEAQGIVAEDQGAAQ